MLGITNLKYESFIPHKLPSDIKDLSIKYKNMTYLE